MAEAKVQKRESAEVERAERIREGKTFIPATDIVETEDKILLLADMPGVDEKSINVTLENNVLTIEGQQTTNEPENMSLFYSEYETGNYYRSFTLGDAIDRAKIEAKYKGGVLHLILPKAEEAKSRKIEVNFEQ